MAISTGQLQRAGWNTGSTAPVTSRARLLRCEAAARNVSGLGL